MEINKVVMLQLQLLLLIASVASINSSNVTTTLGLPGCPTECGGINIPYPFGIGDNCSREGFDITCNNTFTPAKPFIGTGNLEILHISPFDSAHELVAKVFMANQIFNQSGWQSGWSVDAWLGGPFVFSTTQNKFFVLGCYTLGYIMGAADNKTYGSGCVTICSGESSITNGSCDGMGCCQTSIPKGLTDYSIFFDEGFTNATQYMDYSPCNYAFVAQTNWFNFTSADLFVDFGINNDALVPIVMDWAIRENKTCKDFVQTNIPDSSYACLSNNSLCNDSNNGEGYFCNCSKGYHGNPYLVDGCKDINECDVDLQEQYRCYGSCTNFVGSYTCICPDGTSGNASIQGGCIPIQHQSKFPLGAKLAVGSSVGIMVLISVSSSIILSYLKRKNKEERDMFFKQNGGLILFETIRSKRVDTVQIFTMEELEEATDNFDDDRIIGRGGRGMVYRGVLNDGRVVAIKKSRVFDEDQKEEFVNEMIILSQINHRNVVKLLGCCLEIDVPLLVYEMVSKGSLYGILHEHQPSSSLAIKLGMRLQIAAESAEALAHLHYSISRPIIHGDVKSQNILLDDKFTARISDFGASQLVPLDETEFLLFVQGTLGYLDPECLLTHRLTDKSDVYSFGVVLVELLTRKMAIYTDNISGQKRNLSSVFIEAMKEKKLGDILDYQIVEEGDAEIIQQVAELAKQCLCVKGEERPTMRQVSERLYYLIGQFKQHPWQQQETGEEEENSLLYQDNTTYKNYYGGEGHEINTSTTDFIAMHSTGLALNIEEGR